MFENLALGFEVAFSIQNPASTARGVALGTLIGVLPGITLVAIGMLFPLTFTLPPIPSLIMLAGIYYGAQYGGSTTSILVNLPGETGAAVTCIDGYQMARQGRAGPALAVAALASFFAGCVGTLLIALVGPPLGEWALKFGSWEYCALMLMGSVASAVLAHGDAVKGLAMVALGPSSASWAPTSTRARCVSRSTCLRRRHRLHGDRGGAVRGGRDRFQPRVARAARGVRRQDPAPHAEPPRPWRFRLADGARHRGARCSACCRERDPRFLPSPPTCWRRSSRKP